MRRRGFTLIELILVCGIIAVLLGIVITAARGAITSSRKNLRTAICTTVKQGLLTYQAQKGSFPVEHGTPRTEYDQAMGTYSYKADEVRDMVKALVEEAKKGNPLIDISALYVSTSRDRGMQERKGASVKKARGMDFLTAIHGSKQHPKKMRLSEMYFGVPDDDGTFRRLSVVYAIQTDSLKVQSIEDEDYKAPEQ